MSRQRNAAPLLLRHDGHSLHLVGQFVVAASNKEICVRERFLRLLQCLVASRGVRKRYTSMTVVEQVENAICVQTHRSVPLLWGHLGAELLVRHVLSLSGGRRRLQRYRTPLPSSREERFRFSPSCHYQHHRTRRAVPGGLRLGLALGGSSALFSFHDLKSTRLGKYDAISPPKSPPFLAHCGTNSDRIDYTHLTKFKQ